MINVEYVQMMARYTVWQNTSITKAAEALNDTERNNQRGAFFGSIQGTLNHLLWGDRIWMHRFAGTDKPSMESIQESIAETCGWIEYCKERSAMDIAISDWSKSLNPTWFEGELSWFSGAVNRQVSKPKETLIVHFFNHGTHHRGQVHAMLTASGCTPDDTDLPFMPD